MVRRCITAIIAANISGLSRRGGGKALIEAGRDHAFWNDGEECEFVRTVSRCSVLFFCDGSSGVIRVQE